MASFNVVINSKFKPFSYQEMLHPVMMADLEHKAIDASISELGTKASVWEGMANELTDPKAYRMYSEYSNSLKELADLLASQGLSLDSRRAMNNLRQRYSSDIVPIEQAYTRRKELLDELRKARLLNPSIIYDRNMDQASLDDLIANPSLQPQSISGALLTQQVGLAATNLKKQLQDDLKNNPQKAGEWKRLFGGQYFERIIRDGFSQEDVLAAMQGLGPKILTDLVQNAVNSSGVLNWNNPEAMKQASYYANQGLYNAIGDYKVDRVNNKLWDFDALLRLANAKKKMNELPQAKGSIFRSQAITNVKRDVDTQKAKENLEFLNKLKSDPSLLNKTATRLVREPRMFSPDPMISMALDSGTGPTKEVTYNPAKEKLDELTKKYGDMNIKIENGQITGGNIDKVIDALTKEISGSAVLSRSYIPNITDASLINQVLNENLLSTYGRSGKTGIKEIKDGKVSQKFMSDKDANELFKGARNIEYDPNLGFKVLSVNDKGEAKYAWVDPELVTSNSLPNPLAGLSGQSESINQYLLVLNHINEALTLGDSETANGLIEGLMGDIHYRFNTLMKRQSNTDSKAASD